MIGLPRALHPRFTLIWLLAIAACGQVAPESPSPGPASASQEGAASRSGRALALVLRAEPDSLAGTRLGIAGPGNRTSSRMFNAGFSLPDADDKPLPYLAEALPELHSDNWRVFPDGRMETIFQLRPRLVWHDSAPLSAADFVFAWRVYATPQFGISGSPPHSLMEEVVARDERTVAIRWRQPFPDASGLRGAGGGGAAQGTSFAPLPRHVLERPFQDQREGFAEASFWTTEYVGLGPFRLEQWQPGAVIEAGAFDGHALGRPRIDRIRLTFSADFNTTLANLLAGEVHMSVDDSIRFQQAVILSREWGSRNSGTVQYLPRQWRVIQVQLRPEYVGSRSILDVRVRRALAHILDRDAINETLFEGVGIIADTMVPASEHYFPLVDRALHKYPVDPRRSQELMQESGYLRGPDGYYGNPAERRVTLEIKNIASAQNDAERAIMANGWRTAGFEIEERAFTPVEAQDPLARGVLERCTR